MSNLPYEYAESLRIGTVEFVSPDEIKVSLDIEAPESMALNVGVPRPFPRVNSYVLIPVDDAYLVGQIEWITVERSAFPKRRGMQDFGLIDLPFPLRKMSLNPLGMLRNTSAKPTDSSSFSFRRGADALPSIGNAVLLPTEDQLKSIVESGARRRVKVGTSPLASNAEVRVDPDRLFGRHLAVLGNTGSGKSCSVAGLIRWSVEQAHKEGGKIPNARFVVLDPNGEYSRAFEDTKPPLKAKLFQVNPPAGSACKPLHIPLWFWSSSEWSSFTQASSRTQRPVLIHALRSVRDGHIEPAADATQDRRRFLRTVVSTLTLEKNAGVPWGSFPKPKNFLEKVKKWRDTLNQDLTGTVGAQHDALSAFVDRLDELISPRSIPHAHADFSRLEVEDLIRLASVAHSAFGGSVTDAEPLDVDAPLPFSGESLLRSVEASAEMMNVSEHTETLLIRIRSLLSSIIVRSIMNDSPEVTLQGWLEEYIGSEDLDSGCVSVLDLSLVPTEVIHVVTAVVARMIFEGLQRYRRIHGTVLPTVLVMEEAHTFIKRYKTDGESYDAASVCCQVFERISREGRKFGLGLVLSSQRPSELSPTVLSQCNSFLLHRISNDHDQKLIHSLVPDNLKGLLRELPSLPSQYAILLGWASELPLLVKMNDLPVAHQPKSDDPDFWNVWTGRDDTGDVVLRPARWKDVAEQWQGAQAEEQEEDEDDDIPF
ncbi:ATP-binding protein [Terriglobus albidus]|uniref:ATP-binding protein n=1 Tax=Terriglobus albidus TaxID=1592106 RepID=UPI0021E0513E|nr:ATP-binding protein [Terriglobus albidus]